MRYRPDIDGLRCVAILTVLLYHFDFGAFSGGFVGVDVFFVISGYLITSIISREVEAGEFSLARFYERRCRRILPPLFVVVAASIAGGLVVMMPADLTQLARSAVATLAFVSNFWFWWYGGDYFARTVENQPLLHTWSLAVEEQFYVVFPLLFLLVHRFRPKRTKAVIVILSALSLAMSVGGVSSEPVAAFYFSPARFWELGVGCALALGALKLPAARGLREMLAVLGVGLIAIPVIAYDGGTVFPGWTAMPPVLGAALLILVNTGHGLTVVGRALASPVPVWIGKVSYSLYLWHWPLIALATYTVGGAPLGLEARIVLVAITFGLAALSWRFVERPFRVSRMDRKAVFALSGSVAAVLAACAIGIVLKSGLPQRLDDSELALASYVDVRDQRTPECVDSVLERHVCVFGNGKPRIALWGDSHADALAPAILKAAAEHGRSVAFLSNAACAPLLNMERKDVPRCGQANRASAAYILSDPTIDTVILSARWAYWQSMRLPFSDRQHLKLWSSDGSPADFDRSLNLTVTKLRQAGKKVIVIGSVPELPGAVPERMFAEERLGLPPGSPLQLADVRRRNAGVDPVLKQLSESSGIRVLDAARLVCAPVCVTKFAGRPAYRDSNHLTPEAATRMLSGPLSKLLTSNGEQRMKAD